MLAESVYVVGPPFAAHNKTLEMMLKVDQGAQRLYCLAGSAKVALALPKTQSEIFFLLFLCVCLHVVVGSVAV